METKKLAIVRPLSNVAEVDSYHGVCKERRIMLETCINIITARH